MPSSQAGTRNVRHGGRAWRRGAWRSLLAALALCACPLAGVMAAESTPAEITPAEIGTTDVARFFAVLDRHGGHPDAQALEREYLLPGSDALHDFARTRIGSAAKLAAAIAGKPALFRRARDCAAVLPSVRTRLEASLVRLGELVPAANWPPVTIVVGRGNTGGSTSANGVIIGLETLCSADWMQPRLEDRFVHLIAHEYAHVQQPGAMAEVAAPDVLYQTLLEGGAELVGELISGEAANAHLHRWARGRECALEREFLAGHNDTDLSRWLYNGAGDDSRRGDLGYWVGYRIAHAYYARAADKRRALHELLQVRPEAAESLLRESGWHPQCGTDEAGAPANAPRHGGEGR